MVCRAGSLAHLAAAVLLSSAAVAEAPDLDVRMSMASHGDLPTNWNVLFLPDGAASGLIDFDTGLPTSVDVSWSGWRNQQVDSNSWPFGDIDWVVVSAARSSFFDNDLEDSVVVLSGLENEPVRIEVLAVHRSSFLMDVTANGVFATANANDTPGVNGDDYSALQQGQVQGNWLIWDITPVGGVVEILFEGQPDFETSSAIRVSSRIPLLAVLEEFVAHATSGGVLIEWSTSQEIGNAGFRVLAGAAGVEPVAISPIIPARGDELGGASYRYVDARRQATRGRLYYLEDIDLDGNVTRHGPATVDGLAGRAGWRAAPAAR